MSDATRGSLAVLLAAVLWGTTGTAAALAPAVDPLAIGAAAMGIGGLLQGAIAIRAIRRDRGLLRAHLPLLVMGGACVALYPLAFYTSMRLGGVAVGVVVSLASAPLASAVVERVVDGTRLTRRWMLAASLGIAGGALLCVARAGGSGVAGPDTLWSVLLGLIAGVAYALYAWAAHRLMGVGVSRQAAMGSIFGVGGLALVPVLAATGGTVLGSPLAFGVAAYLALVPMFAGYVLFGVGIARIGASTATTLTLAEPAIAAVLAVIVLGERLGAPGWVGLAGVAAGLMLLAAPSGSRSRADTTSSDAPRLGPSTPEGGGPAAA